MTSLLLHNQTAQCPSWSNSVVTCLTAYIRIHTHFISFSRQSPHYVLSLTQTVIILILHPVWYCQLHFRVEGYRPRNVTDLLWILKNELEIGKNSKCWIVAWFSSVRILQVITAIWWYSETLKSICWIYNVSSCIEYFEHLAAKIVHYWDIGASVASKGFRLLEWITSFCYSQSGWHSLTFGGRTSVKRPTKEYFPFVTCWQTYTATECQSVQRCEPSLKHIEKPGIKLEVRWKTENFTQKLKLKIF